MLSVLFSYSYSECCCIECCIFLLVFWMSSCWESHFLIVILNVIMLSVAFSFSECFLMVILNIVMLSVAFSYCYSECHYAEYCIFLLLSVLFHCDTQHNDWVSLSWVSHFLILNVVMLRVTFSYGYSECCYAECFLIAILNVIMLSVTFSYCYFEVMLCWVSYFLIVILNVIMLSVILLNVDSPVLRPIRLFSVGSFLSTTMSSRRSKP
jgi:hypothetical protein